MQEDIIIKKLTEHDAKFVQIDERFDRVDAKFVQIDERFDRVDAKFVQIDERLDKLTSVVIEHGERLDQTVTKTEFEAFRKEQMNANDQMITILKRLDEERFATIEWLRRVEKEVEDQKKKTYEHEIALQRIKQELKLAF
ncbi:hypothetical protein HYW94_02700 [Candidatus Uhrbacteria bacterium]|nr:hypothetical protein [Candidatus Uhrbacteria bacterium]